MRNTDINYKDLAIEVLTWTLLKQDDLSISDFYDIYSRRYTAVDKDEAVEVGERAAQEEQQGSTESTIAANIALYSDQVQKAARTFVRITASNGLQEQHQNVRECFLAGLTGEIAEDGSYQISQVEGHLRIARELLRVLNSDEFAQEHMPVARIWESQETLASSQKSNWEFWNQKGQAKKPKNGPVTEGSDGELDRNAKSSQTPDRPSETTSREQRNDSDTKAEERDTVNGEANQPNSSAELAGNDTSDATMPDTFNDESTYDYDSDDGSLKAPLLRLKGRSAASTDPLPRRYEIWNWFRHLKYAEDAAGPDDPKTGGLWEDVWTELRRFMLNLLRVRCWMMVSLYK